MTAQLDADCEQRRTTYVGTMVLLALPTTLLAAYGLIGYRGRPTATSPRGETRRARRASAGPAQL